MAQAGIRHRLPADVTAHTTPDVSRRDKAGLDQRPWHGYRYGWSNVSLRPEITDAKEGRRPEVP